jgi:hypothetical protein
VYLLAIHAIKSPFTGKTQNERKTTSHSKTLDSFIIIFIP